MKEVPFSFLPAFERLLQERDDFMRRDNPAAQRVFLQRGNAKSEIGNMSITECEPMFKLGHRDSLTTA